LRKELGVLIAAMIALSGAAVVLLPAGAQADVSNADAIALVDGNSFGVRLKWTHETAEGLEIRLYHNNNIVKTVSVMWGDPGRNGTGSIDSSPVKAGTYKVTLWSNSYNKEVYSRSWDVPRLNMTVAVDPGSGLMGTTFVATTTFFINATALDMIRFSGTLETDAGPAVFRQAVVGTLYSDHYYSYNEKAGYTIEPVFFTTGFTFPAGGNYTVSARYNDSTTNISALSENIVMVDQYISQIAELHDELNESAASLDAMGARLQGAMDLLAAVNDTLNGTIGALSEMGKQLNDTRGAQCETDRKLNETKAGLDATGAALKGAEDRLAALNGTLNETKSALGEAKRDLNDTRARLDATGAELADARKQLSAARGDQNKTTNELGRTKKDMNDKTNASNQIAYSAMVVGVLGIVLGAAGIAMSRQRKDGSPASSPPPVQQAPAPVVQAPPPVQQAPAPAPSPQEAPRTAPDPSSPSPCTRCGTLVATGMRFCGNCGAPR